MQSMVMGTSNLVRAAAACLMLWACSGGAPADEGTGGSTGSDDGTGGTPSSGGGAGGGTMSGGGSGTGGALTGGQASVGGDVGAGGDAGETGGGGTGGGGGDGGAAPGAGGTPMGTCGEPPLEVMGPAATHSVADGPAPPPQGGALADGLYDAATQVRYYDYTLPAEDPNLRQVVRIREGGTFLDQFSVQRQDQSSHQSLTVTIVASEAELIMSPMCPNDGGGYTFTMPYSTRPGEIDLYVDYADGPETRYGVITHVLRQ